MKSEDNKKTKSKMGIIIAIVLIILILIVLVLLNSCGKDTNAPQQTPDATQTQLQSASITPQATPTDVLGQFYDEKIKHGKVSFVSVGDPQEMEFWIDGDNYRLTWYNSDGSVRMHMISPDGENLYNCYADDKICKIAYIRPEFHQWIFNGPEGWTPGAGIKEGDYNVYTFTAKRLWDIEGATQQFYLEDLKIYSDGEKIVKVVTRTKDRKPESESELVTSTYTIESFEYLKSIPEDMFTLPYPMENS